MWDKTQLLDIWIMEFVWHLFALLPQNEAILCRMGHKCQIALNGTL